MAYAVLNAARAPHFAGTGVMCSKLDGGAWALDHGEAPGVLPPAVAAQQGVPAATITQVQADWVDQIARQLQQLANR